MTLYLNDVASVHDQQRQVMGKTLLDPKKDSKWERGRTRQALHFGAHVRGGKAVGAEVCSTPCTFSIAVLYCSHEKSALTDVVSHNKNIAYREP